jgi:dienelactone hydrolase
VAITKQAVRYDIGGKSHESLAVWDENGLGQRPAVLIAPTFMGRSAFEEGKAEVFATLGFVGFVIDIFGIEVKPTNAEEATTAMQVLNDDRKGLAAVMTAALDQACALDVVDASKVAAIGFCFGGKCVLDLARTGADLKGVATFHGIFDRPPFESAATIPAKILALHGWDDPLAKPEDVIAFAAEMTDRRADWQLHAYGHTRHGFTAKHRPQMYDETADRRSWQALETFLSELFG